MDQALGQPWQLLQVHLCSGSNRPYAKRGLTPTEATVKSPYSKSELLGRVLCHIREVGSRADVLMEQVRWKVC